ncbi:MAG: hypothetical protein HY812_17625 [Planctomycetes bacterium]|nr:hypothetical protein [Planctomycetota bacterium]
MRGALLLLALAPWLAALSCGRAQNTPEEALAALRSALREERWELLFDVLPLAAREDVERQIAEHDARLAALAAKGGRAAADQDLRLSLGLTFAQWGRMSTAERYAAAFAPLAAEILPALGVSRDLILDGAVSSVELRGAAAVLLLDDGRGHRGRVHFLLAEDLWRVEMDALPPLALAPAAPARNTPEEALAALKTALAEQRWDLLYDLLPGAAQEDLDRQIAENDARIKELAAQQGEAAADEVLLCELGVTFCRWSKMTARERFALVFAPMAGEVLARLKVDPALVIAASVRSVSVRGEEATLLLEDGQGRSGRLTFVLADGLWRFQGGS